MTVVDPTTTLFRSEYELELEAWLRRRFRSVCVWFLILGAAVILVRTISLIASDNSNRWPAVGIILAAGIAQVWVIGYFLLGKHWAAATRPQLLHATTLMILLLGSVSIFKEAIMQVTLGVRESNILLLMFFWHFVACAFLPWTPRESLKPIIPLMILWAARMLFVETNDLLSSRILSVVFGPGILIPGLIICSVRLKRHSELFRTKMFGRQYLTMRQEFSRARSIHESLFPQPHDDGHIRFEYTYTPMRELGGDYVHLHVGQDGLMHLTLIDVTGHGLPAALTINRLYGELERIRAENLDAEPGEVLTLLNRYINLTLTKHNIYATAACLAIDPYQGLLHYANAGHPPAFLRGANGVVRELAATAVLLGALPASDFVADQRTVELSPGDILIIYTDGAFEARDRLGRSLGLKNLQQLMNQTPPPRNWPQFITSTVEKHHAGRADDDILVAAVTFLLPRPQSANVPQAVSATS